MVIGGGSRMGQLKTVAMRNNELQTRVSNVFNHKAQYIKNKYVNFY